jgi:hypothetical protein
MKIKNPVWVIVHMCTSHVLHLVNSTGPSSLNVHILICEFIVLKFYEIHYKMSGMLSELEA